MPRRRHDTRCSSDHKAHETPYRWRWLVLAVTLCAAVMDLVDSTVINVAAPSIQQDIGGGQGTIQWLAAGYTLAFAVFLITGGRLGDIYGRRLMFILGACGFTAASLSCAFAVSPSELIGARVLQGVFGALLIPQGFGILKAVFPRRELSQAFGAFAPVMGLSSVCGPIVAGSLINADILGTGWRAIFLINVPLGLAAIAGAVRVFPRDQIRRRIRLDLVGAALVTIAALLVVYPLVQGRERGWPLWSLLMLAAGVLSFVAFAAYERMTRRAPVIEPSLLLNRTFTSGLATAVVFFGVVAGFQLVLSLYLQTMLHFTALHAGLTGAPMSVGIVLAAAGSYRLVPRLGRRVLHGGLAVVTVGMVALAGIVAHFQLAVTSWHLAPAILMTGAGMGLVFGPLFGVILEGVADPEVGSASGTLSAAQQLGGALGVAAIATLFFSLTGNAPNAALAMSLTSLSCAAGTATAFGLAFLLPERARPHTDAGA